ncbi:MAG: hypothetical protein WB809_02140 [Thermoplasmata archaeon]
MSGYRSSLPVGVAIIAILIGILGFFTLLFGILVLVGIGASAYFGVPVFLGVGGLTLALIVIILGIVELAVAYGLWDLNMWALVLAILVLIVEMAIYGLAGAFLSLGFLLSLVLFIYLLAVSRHFS